MSLGWKLFLAFALVIALGVATLWVAFRDAMTGSLLVGTAGPGQGSTLAFTLPLA